MKRLSYKYLEDLIRGERSLDLTPLGVEATRMAEIIVERGLNDVDEIDADGSMKISTEEIKLNDVEDLPF